MTSVLSRVLFVLALTIIVAGCEMSDPVSPDQLDLKVLPVDTVVVRSGDSVTFDCYVSRDGFALGSQWISVLPPGESSFQEMGRTDSSGHLYIHTPALLEANAPYRYAFVVTLPGGYHRSFVIYRTIVVRTFAPIVATITASGVADDGSLVAEPYLPITRSVARRSIELLPRIFFDNNSSALPERYRPSGIAAHVTDITTELDLNHRLLDIVGERMTAMPSARLLLTGTNANDGSEKGNIMLSRARALSVRDYLTASWHIDSTRIDLDVRNLPSIPTNPTLASGIAENRRVELSSIDSALLAPALADFVMDSSVGQARVAFRVTVSASVASYTITADPQGQKIMTDITGIGRPPDTIITFLRLTKEQVDLPIHYSIVVRDSSGEQASADGFTRAMPRVMNKIIPGNARVWFDFERPDLSPQALQQLQSYSATVGDYPNLELSGFISLPETEAGIATSRMESVQASLESVLPAVIVLKPGVAYLPAFPNELPEGRQLNRRVEIRVVQ